MVPFHLRAFGSGRFWQQTNSMPLLSNFMVQSWLLGTVHVLNLRLIFKTFEKAENHLAHLTIVYLEQSQVHLEMKNISV